MTRLVKFLIFQHWLIFLILVAAAILRFWRLESLTTFGGDQGYDFLIVKRIIVDGKFTLLGPKIGPYNQLGNLYLGPAYYYLLAPALLLSRLDPIGPAIMTVLFSLGTILVIYLICQRFVSKGVSILAAAFYAFNSFLIDQDRAPSNPHLAPFFSAIVIFAFLQIIARDQRSRIWIFICGVSLGILFQLHYLGVSLTLAVILVLFFRRYFWGIVQMMTAFILALSPQILFELRHNFFVTNLFLKQIASGGNIINLSLFADHINSSFTILFSPFLGSPPDLIAQILLFALIISTILFAAKKWQVPLFLSLTIITNIIAASLYFGPTHFHYFAAVYPSLVILVSLTVVWVWQKLKNPLLKATIAMIIAQIFANSFLNFNLNRNEGYTMPKGWNLIGIKTTSKIIANDVTSQANFNVASTLDGDTRAMPYRYLIEVYGKKPSGVEDYPSSTILYLVSRDDQEMIKRYTVWEVSSFMPFEVVEEWEIQNGIKLYKLTKV
ncbi:glycosyltransferase family 39 protein [Candidatus Curtissbacteria bacterium]|nr:glycosyltransferase family 39 protein [Candidatus Curtissbacteria bacterium]